MHIAVIGAGLAGICAAKHSLARGYEVTVFEQTDKIGGTWVYTDETDKDKHSLEIQSSMYKGLITNLPKEVMSYPDFPFPQQDKSFIPAEDVLNYLNLYVANFNIEPNIKYEHNVIWVRPKGARIIKWEILVKDLKNDTYKTHLFDAVMVCNGHYSKPVIPNYPGQDIFTGQQLHSHQYRRSDSFKDKNVLVIGLGPSSMDISHQLSTVAKKITISHHDRSNPPKVLPEYFHAKPDVAKLTETGAEFIDGSHEEFSTILYCTGYDYSFSFLSMDCGITIDDKYIQKLYKHSINIQYPTMTFIGLPYLVEPAPCFDLQIRFFLKYLSNEKEFPTKEEMLADERRDMAKRTEMGFPKRKAHVLGPLLKEYYDDLANTADLSPLPLYLTKIYTENRLDMQRDFVKYRENRYRIIDDNNYEKF